MKKKIPYSRQSISKKDIDKVTKVLKSNFISRGPVNKEFENQINKYVKSKYCVSSNSGTSSLYLACKSLDLKDNDIVWTSPNSFAASANCAVLCGAKIDFVDINSENYNISIAALEQKLKIAKKKNKLPKVIIPVHYAGLSCDMEKLFTLKKKYNFFIIEDASHALGGKYKNYKVGSCKYSDLTVFSFQAVKVITTGEGGAVTTNNHKFYQKMLLLRQHGITRDKNYFFEKKNSFYPWYYEQIGISFNFILSDINAALGLSQLKRINQNIKQRNAMVKYYQKKLLNSNIKFITIPKNYQSSHHLLPASYNFRSLNHKAAFFYYMKKNNIFLQLLYIPIYRHPFYKKMKFKVKNFYNMEKFYKKSFSLPLHLQIKKKDIDYICSKINSWFKKC